MAFRGYRSTLTYTTSALALAVTFAAPSFAQQAAQSGQSAQSGIALEEIIVNARRVDENIQRVPIAVTAFTPEKLAAQDVKDIWSLTKNIGGLNICCSPGTASFVFLRGIGNGAPTYFADVPTVGTGFSNFFDVSSVQVLKGPQGTLFGEASNAGALIYTPRKPGESFGGNVSITGGNYGRRSLEGAIDVPIIEDKVLFRMAAQSYYRNGFIIDIKTNKDIGNQNYYILRPSLILRPTEDIENYTLLQLTKSKSNGNDNLFVVSDFNFSPTSQLPILGTQAALYATTGLTNGSRAAFDALRDAVLAEQLALGRYKVNGYSTECATEFGPRPGACLFQWSRNWFLANTTTWNFTDQWSVKNIFGYRDSTSFAQPGDTDGTRLILFDGGNGKNITPTNGAPTWSDEIQFQGTDVFGILDLTIGTFHTATHNNPMVTYGRTLGFSALQTASITKTSSRSRAVYAQGNADLGAVLEGLSATAGYRYTWDSVFRHNFNLNPNTLAVTSIQGGRGTPGGEGHFSSGSYTFGAQYQYSPDIMFFITNAKGFSSGGLQNVIGLEKFGPDSLNNIEVGTKATFDVGDWKVRSNISYYYGWFDNVKASVTQLAQQQPPPAPKNLVVVTQNAAKATISGVDADITIVPTDWLEVGGFVAYTDAIYTDWPSISSITLLPISLASTPFSFTSKWKWSARGTVHLPVDESWGDMSISANLTHTGVLYNVAKPVVPVDPTNPNSGILCTRARTAANGYGPLSADGKIARVDCNPPYYNLDMNFDWRDPLGYEGLNVSVGVTNITKNEQADGGCACDVALGLTSPTVQVPRMFTIRLAYSF